MSSIATSSAHTVVEPAQNRIREWWFWNVRHRLYWRVGQFTGRAHGHGPLLLAVGDSLTDPCIGFTFPWQVWPRRVGRAGGYRTVNLGIGGETTGDMCRRIEEFLIEGRPEMVVVCAGNVDAERFVDPVDIKRNLTLIIKRLGEDGVGKIALIGPATLNLPQVPAYLPAAADYFASIDTVRKVFRDVAAQHNVVFVDLAQFLRDRIASGLDPDFSRETYRQSRSWHAVASDGHFNAYGQRLVAEAFLAATADWRPARP